MAWNFVGGVGSFVAAVFLARLLGRALRGHPAGWYWLSSAVVLVAAMLLIVASAASALLFYVGVGLGFGGLAGLRYGWKGLFTVSHSKTASGDRVERAREDGGFTLIESLTAASILLIVAGGVITTLIATSSWYANARLRTQGYAIANEVMANILSRNYPDIHFASTGETWPSGIPTRMDWPRTGTKQFTVLTSMETTTDPKTGLEMKKIDVSALPVAQSLVPTVTVTRFASGWQGLASSTQRFYVTVKVTLVGMSMPGVPGGTPVVGRGARVQLLDTDTLSEKYFATTDDSGVATLYNVLEGQYYLTSDPRFGTNIRPVYFPQRISPTHGGSANNPIMPVNSYDLYVTNSGIGATLRVGAYRGEGWTVINQLPQPPDVPYRIVQGLTIYAAPVLNGTDNLGSSYYGMGNAPLYPDESKLPVYSATVNAYGVAAIPIPWTIDPSIQHWRVWCRVKDPKTDTTYTYKFTTTASGGWESRVQRPDGAFNNPASYGSIPQFTRLGDGMIAVNDPTMPAF